MVDVLRKTIRPHNKEVLTNVVKAQASTIKRSQITVAGQYRWHRMVDKAYEILRTRNQGALPDGRTFGEVIENFVLGGDETCFLASGGDVRILGDKKKKKHEKATANSRTSTTIYRVGSAAGMTGPTAFLPPGVAKPTSTRAHARTHTNTPPPHPVGIRRKHGYTDEFLVRHGASAGMSTAPLPSLL